MEYENVIRKVLLLIESILQNAKQLQYARLSWHVRCPCVFQHLWCNCFVRSKNSELQFIERGHRGLVNNVLNVSPQGDIKWLNIGWAERPEIGPSRPNQRPGKCMSRNSLTIRAQYGGAPSCQNTTCGSTALPNKTFLSYIFIFLKQFYFIIPGLKIIDHGVPDNNLESLCITQRRTSRLLKVSQGNETTKEYVTWMDTIKYAYIIL
jgi:hypothetical protein